MNLKRLQNTLNSLNKFTDEGLGINRLAYTDTEQRASNYLIELFKQAGLTVRVDAVGNVIARREGAYSHLPVVAFGSHIDSVYEAGEYDGTVGVVAALEVIRSLNDKRIKTEHPLEVIVFACEESARFGISTLGSKAMTGLLEEKDIAELKDKNDITLSDEFSKYSLNIGKLKEAERQKEEIEVFLELHIEQGPILENSGKQIGIVTGIAGPTRFKLQINGQSSHSGTTPMGYRKDAFLGAAEIALSIESAAISEASEGTVATVGVCDVKPGAMNIVPGLVEIDVDIRGNSAASKEVVIKQLLKAIDKVENSRKLRINYTKIGDEQPTEMDPVITRSIEETCKESGYSYQLMPSGAGHDAMNMAKLFPASLLFIPSNDGLSHNPEEYTSWEQIAVGARLLEKEILKWAKVYKSSIRGELHESQ
ncbi:Zn-dependent hydrolase [Virgibacillus sp. JSM 102003]|uniref:Zn-dependent hydrolase n=1 Tax=Virgibacillus sp. JSM 102003 TaxID=1562108 RepID=UPI0035BF4CBC